MPCPKVSVVVPVYNVRPYLRQCLDSILNQTLSEIEILCGDGGSTDGSLEILREYEQRDSRLQVISKDGSGYGESVNDCIRMARGEYIGLVESDDCIKPKMYEVLYQRAKEHALDWVRGDIYFYYTSKSGKPILRFEKIIIGNFYNRVLNPQKDYRPYRSRLRTWSGIYNRRFLLSNDIWHSETPGGSFQDTGFYLKTLYYAERVEFIHLGFYQWRQDNPWSSTHYDSKRTVQKVLKEWSLQEDYLAERPELAKRVMPAFRYRQMLSYFWTIDRVQDADKQYMCDLSTEMLNAAKSNGEIDREFFTWLEWQQYRGFLKNGQTAGPVRLLWRRLKHMEAVLFNHCL